MSNNKQHLTTHSLGLTLCRDVREKAEVENGGQG
jgi:hypothetical protein